MKKPLVSVIIPTKNSEQTIETCLKSVKAQTYSNIEVIIVDDYSTDRTREIAEKYDAMVVLCRADRSRARNVGCGLAKGEFILSIDSDMDLTQRVIEECLEAIESSEGTGGAIIPERSVGNSFWVKVRDFERSFYANTEIESARFFRKNLVEEVNGFDEDIVFFEDSTLPQKIEGLGFNVKVRIDAEILHREDNFSLWKWLKKKFYYGKSYSQYKEKFDKYATKQVNILHRFSIFFKNKRFYSKPLLASGVIILKFFEYFSAGLGLLVSKITNR